ncbi:S8 family serine peptidase [Reinekea sp.]|uniref:S8 family serine peptidase n=1 Tax=Reinekea sp. TaxID=1970455 RepID=UPI00257C602B|nr:S8 family serine peptidase [Reinekea sp.]
MLVNKLSLGHVFLSVFGLFASVSIGAQTTIVSDQGALTSDNLVALDIAAPDRSAQWEANQLIVKFKGSAPFAAAANRAGPVSPASSPSVAGELLAQHQARVLDQFKLNSIDSALPDGLPVAVRLAASSIEERVYLLEVDSADVNPLAQALQASGEVEYAEPNYLYYVTMTPNDPLYDNGNNPALWGLNAIHANQAWDQTSGAGAIVAVIDTGLYLDHPDIRDNVWLNVDEIANNGIDDDRNGKVDDTHGWDFANSDNSPSDGYGHGTHVSGTIAATGNNGVGIIGVAHGAKIMPLKALRDDGGGSAFNIALAINYAADNRADVINMSLAGQGFSSTLEQAVTRALVMDVVVIAAAGNNMINSQYLYPANIPGLISVGSVANVTGALPTLSTFSNTGPDIDLVAPGSNILSLKNDGGYKTSSGTSMAAPHVAGLAALIRAKYPDLTPAQVRALLVSTTTDLTSSGGLPGWDDIYGHGLINAQAALQASPERITAAPFIFSPAINLPAGESIQLNGPVVIQGSTVGVMGSHIGHYEIAVAKKESEALQFETIFTAEDSVIRGNLGTWDTTAFSNGTYLVRLRVVDQAGLQADVYQRVYLDNTLASGWPALVSGWLGHPAGSTEGRVPARTPALIDLDGNGDLEILTVQNDRGWHRNVFAWHHDGSRFGSYAFASPEVTEIVTPITLADVDGDTQDDIIFGARQVSVGGMDSIFAYNLEGQLLPGFPAGWSGDRYPNLTTVTTLYDRVVAADLNGDGKSELIVQKLDWNNGGATHYTWKVMVIGPDGAITQGWPKEVFFANLSQLYANAGGTGALRQLVVADWNYDGLLDVIAIWPNIDSGVHARVFSANGVELGRINFATSVLNDVRSPIVVDLDQDGEVEYLVHVGNNLYAYSMGGAIKSGWPVAIDSSTSPYGGDFGIRATDLIVSDIDNSGDLELILSSSEETMILNSDGSLRQPIFILKRNGGLDFTARTTDMDSIDGQGLFYGGMNAENSLQARSLDGNLLENWPKQVVPISGGVAIGDLDQDGQAEAVAHSMDGFLYVWHLDSHSASAQASQSWPVLNGNAAQTRAIYSDSVNLPGCVAQFNGLNVRGSFNDWGNTAMIWNPNSCVWQANVTAVAGANLRFKFDRFGDWSENYGDTNGDRIAELGGGDIPLDAGAGSYTIRLDDQSLAYSLESVESMPNSAALSLRCDNGYTDFGTSVYIAGNHPALGNWTIKSELKLVPANYPSWSATVENLPAGTDFEWKCVKADEQSLAVVQWQVGGNNTATTGSDGSVTETNGSF